MQDFLIEVINYVPSYYPFTERDGSIGVADFYSQQPVSNFKKLHDDAVYRNFQKTCDVVGVPVGPCNKLLKGTLLECVRKPPPPINPPPICQENYGVTLPCRCNCIGSCLYRSENTSDYIEDWDRNELLQLIDSVRLFPELDNIDDNNTSFDNEYQRVITHELAGNAYWIGLPPSCEGIWITIVSCADSEFLGFYKLSSPNFGIGNQVQLKGRGQRIKIETETPGIYKTYQVYYSYEFEYKLGLTPPNEMTFTLADTNIVENAMNDDLQVNLSSDVIDTYSRFCYDEFVSFTMRNCIKNNDTQGTLGAIPCVCEQEFNTDFDTTDNLKYVLKKNVPDQKLKYGSFSIENEESGYCMNCSFNRTSPIQAIDPASAYQYYDAFSGDIITWDSGSTWENSGQQNNWFSWERKEGFDAFIWESEKIKENCYSCLIDKKNKNNRIEVPPCENVMCGRVEINANPNGSDFNDWKNIVEGGNNSNILPSQTLEWDMFSKFGFPTDFKYNPYASAELKEKWYDEIENRFIENNQFVPERTQFTIPCHPTIKCEEGSIRVTNIIELVTPCSSKYEETTENYTQIAEGSLHEIFVGIDYRPNSGCSEICPQCSPPSCCVSNNGLYNIASGPIGLVAYDTISVSMDNDYESKTKEKISSLDMTFMECYVKNCNNQNLESNYQNCIQNNLGFENCNGSDEECCEQYAIQECIQDYGNDELFSCNNEDISEVDFARISPFDWQFKGKSLNSCTEDPSLSAPFDCAYEMIPLRPSSKYYQQINVGQCRVSKLGNGDCNDGFVLCDDSFKDPRSSPIYFSGGNKGGHTCPPTFCSKCFPQTYSKCSCCGVTNLNKDEVINSQSKSSECGSCSSNNNCCPECCSTCSKSGTYSCSEELNQILPNWSSQEPCGSSKCEWYFLDWVDCGISCIPTELSGNNCNNDCSLPPGFKCDCEEVYEIYENQNCDPNEEYENNDDGGFGGFGSV